MYMIYNECPICGTLHDDGEHIFHRDKHRYICLNCADKQPLDKEERVKWLDKNLKDWMVCKG